LKDLTVGLENDRELAEVAGDREKAGGSAALEPEGGA